MLANRTRHGPASPLGWRIPTTARVGIIERDAPSIAIGVIPLKVGNELNAGTRLQFRISHSGRFIPSKPVRTRTPQTCTRATSISPSHNFSRHVLSSFSTTADWRTALRPSELIALSATLANRTQHGPTSRHVG
jgi:hypothetical protein